MVWIRRLGSLKVSVVLLATVFVLILGGTLGQCAWGASAVQTTLFTQVLFPLGGVWVPGLPFFLALTGFNLTAGSWFHLHRTWRTFGLWALHGTLVLFCFGSLGFSLARQELVLGLMPGATARQAFPRDAPRASPVDLPFRLTLVSFRVETYPGSREPSDYVSQVTIGLPGKERTAEIRMNQPLREAGWTIYQSSVQPFGKVQAPVFKLTDNPGGWFPYAVSALLFLSAGAHLILRGSKDRYRGE